MFREAIKAALLYRDNSTDYLDEVMKELEVSLFYVNLLFIIIINLTFLLVTNNYLLSGKWTNSLFCMVQYLECIYSTECSFIRGFLSLYMQAMDDLSSVQPVSDSTDKQSEHSSSSSDTWTICHYIFNLSCTAHLRTLYSLQPTIGSLHCYLMFYDQDIYN